MHLEFDYLWLDGFRSFSNPTTLDLDTLPTGLHFMRGRNLLRRRMGSNGAGKSSLWAALTWGLYGRTVNLLRKDDLATWNSDLMPDVEIGLQCDGSAHVIRRNSSLSIDDKTVGQEQVDQLIGMSFELFTHTVLMGQGRPLFLDLEPRNKLALFSDVLELERWDARATAAGERARKLHDACIRIEAEIAANQSSLDIADSGLLALKRQAGAWEQEQLGRLDKTDSDIVALRRQLKPARKNLDDAILADEEANLKLKQVRADLEQASRDLATVQTNYSQFVADDRIKQREIDDLTRQIEEFKDGKCPTCQQPITGKLEKHVAHLHRKIAQTKKGMGIPKLTVQRCEEFGKLTLRLRKQRDELEEQAQKAQEGLNAWRPVVADCEAKIRALETAQTERREQENPYHEQVQALRKRIGLLKQNHKKLADDLALQRRRQVRATFWVRGFKEVKLYQVEEVLQELEIVTNGIVQDVGLVDWSLRYAIEYETKSGNTRRGINVTVLSPDNDEPVRWEAWCGGEQQRLRLIGAMALSEVLLQHAGVDPSLTVLDEPTQHISPEGIGELVEFLADHAQRLKRQIVLIDQHALASDRFASTITVERDKAGSYLPPPEAG